LMFCYVSFQAEDGIRDFHVTGVQTCALPIFRRDEILYIEAMQNYVRLITRQRAHIVNSTMKLMETQFTPPDYIRIHKSYIVAVRSEERRVGKECISRCRRYHEEKNRNDLAMI